MNIRSCTEYDVHLEPGTSNSMFEAVRQFQVISELHYFKNTPFLVFFNTDNDDLLLNKVKCSPLSNVPQSASNFLILQTFKDFNNWCEANPEECKEDEAETAISYFIGKFMDYVLFTNF